MTKLPGKIFIDEVVTFGKKTYVHTETVIPSCSYRRAKKIAKKLGLYMKGSHKKKNVKWTNYTVKAGYSRQRRCMFLIKYVLNEGSHHD